MKKKEMEILKLFVPQLTEESDPEQIKEAMTKVEEETKKIINLLHLNRQCDIKEFFNARLFELRSAADKYRSEIMDAFFFDINYGKGSIREDYNYIESLSEIERKILFYEYVYSQAYQANDILSSPI